jgi:hypothetical protein
MSRFLSAVGIVISLSVACASGRSGPALDTEITPAPRPIDELTVDERAGLLRRASVWHPIDTARADLLNGPPARDGFRFDADVVCGFRFPDKPLTGVTPKFLCEVRPDDVVKVKYGEDNGEVFAEVAATRLFWALGFYADRMYPVGVTCLNCPTDPHTVSAAEWRFGKPGNVRTMRFDPATIERAIAGEDIEVPGYSGWSWQEIEGVAGGAAGATRAQIDALKLLAVFVQHVDSKPDQQAIRCPPDQLRKTRGGNATCAAPRLVVKDLGSTFGAAKIMNQEKMKLQSWSSVPIWKDADRCQGDLTRSIIGTLEHPFISEAGRKFLADRLMLLSDRQLVDLFTAARVERRKDSIDGHQATAADWVRAFKVKRDAIVNHRCPSSTT